MRKKLRIISILIMAIMLMMMFTTVVCAASGTGAASGAESALNNITISYDNGTVTDMGGKIASVISTVGVVVAVVVLLILGIKYMMGSASEKAEYKKTMIPYLVGAILVFAASAITKVVISMATNLTTT